MTARAEALPGGSLAKSRRPELRGSLKDSKPRGREWSGSWDAEAGTVEPSASDRALTGFDVQAEVAARAVDKRMPSAIFAFTCCRSEEHTSELQSLRHLVCRLL